MPKKKTNKEFIQQMEEKHPEIEVLEKYKGDNVLIKIKHKNFENHIWNTTPSNLLKGTSCPYCSNRKPLKNFNTFGDYYLKLLYFFENKEDAFKYTYGSGEKINTICPDCGTKRQIRLNDLKHKGFSCQICKDSVSVPNKFIRNIILLKKDILEEYKFEYIPEWVKIKNTKNFRYDVYFKYKGKTYIIEMNGIQHKTEKWNNKVIKIYDEEKRKWYRLLY